MDLQNVAEKLVILASIETICATDATTVAIITTRITECAVSEQ